MKRDDFNVRIDQVRELATKYSKPELQRMVQMGVVGPQEAVMAGMMIDRIAKSAMQPPTTTVAQDVLGMAPTAEQGQIPPMQEQQPQMPQQMPPSPQMAADGGIMGILPYSDGVAALPTNLPEYAGGGIIAFAGGGDIPGYADRGLTTSEPQPTYLPNNIDFERGNVPVYRTEAPKEVTLSSAAEQRKAAETQAGIDPKFYETLKSDVLKDKEDFTKQRDEAKGMAALQFGLGLMGARKGQEFQTVSAAGQQALAQYGSTLKDIKLSEKEMKKDLRQLTMAEQAYKQSNSDKDLAKVDMYQNKLQESKENYTKALNDGVKLKEDLFKVKTQSETQLKTAQIGKEASLGAATISARSHEKVAGMKGAEERMFDLFHNSELQKNPEQTPLETYKKMKTASGREEARAKMALALEKEWNDMGLKQAEFMEANPNIKNADDYIKAKMALFDNYYGKPGAGAAGAPSGGGTTPPPAAIADLKANASAANRAFFDQTFGPGAAAKALGQ
jgi:hypothetical protein